MKTQIFNSESKSYEVKDPNENSVWNIYWVEHSQVQKDQNSLVYSTEIPELSYDFFNVQVV
jgi:hypothetical protein